MNFEKIINYFRRLGQAIRTKFAGSGSKRGDKSFNERKATTDSKWNRKQGRKSTEDRMTLLDMGDVFLKTLKLCLISLCGYYRPYLVRCRNWLGYLGSQIESVPSIKDKTLLNQISEVSLVSSMSYSDSKKIADIDTDLLRTPIESDAISNKCQKCHHCD